MYYHPFSTNNSSIINSSSTIISNNTSIIRSPLSLTNLFSQMYLNIFTKPRQYGILKEKTIWKEMIP